MTPKEIKSRSCLARHDQSKAYGPGNAFWRKCVTEQEALTGLEELPGVDTPVAIQYTPAEKEERAKLPPKLRDTFDVHARLKRRCEVTPSVIH